MTFVFSLMALEIALTSKLNLLLKEEFLILVEKSLNAKERAREIANFRFYLDGVDHHHFGDDYSFRDRCA